MAKPLIQVIVGSTRDVRVGIKVAQWIFKLAQARPEFDVALVDLKDFDLPFLNEPHSPKMGNYQMESTKRWSETIGRADGYILVTPEYNHAPNAALKNALDTVYNEWNRKPVAFVSYGGPYGGARAVEMLKMITAELQMAPVQAVVGVPLVHQAFDETGSPTNDQLEPAAERLFADLAWWANALKTARETTN